MAELLKLLMKQWKSDADGEDGYGREARGRIANEAVGTDLLLEGLEPPEKSYLMFIILVKLQ